MNFILLGIIIELIGMIYLTLIGCYLVYSDKVFIKIINKCIVKYWLIMGVGLLSMIIGFFAN